MKVINLGLNMYLQKFTNTLAEHPLLYFEGKMLSHSLMTDIPRN